MESLIQCLLLPRKYRQDEGIDQWYEKYIEKKESYLVSYNCLVNTHEIWEMNLRFLLVLILKPQHSSFITNHKNP